MMLGIDPMAQRDRMMEALEIILRLFRGETPQNGPQGRPGGAGQDRLVPPRKRSRPSVARYAALPRGRRDECGDAVGWARRPARLEHENPEDFNTRRKKAAEVMFAKQAAERAARSRAAE